MSTDGERIAKRLARAGLCSRREAERWIEAGRVAVDGRILTSPAVTVTSDSVVQVDGKAVSEPERTRLWRYHKPSGLITSNSDPEGRKTIFDRLPANLPRVMTVGRLDLNSEGLLLLTNDGGLARELELPSRGWTRRYRVRVHGRVDERRLAALAEGTVVDDVRYGPIRATVDRQTGDNAWLSISLEEGRNREVRIVMDHLHYPVNRLIRVAYGPFQLGNLARGSVDEISGRVLRDQLGAGRLSADAADPAGARRRKQRQSGRPPATPR